MKCFLPLCLLLLSTPSHAALNKWVDAEGKVHYSDEAPPANAKAKTLTAPSPASGAPVAKTVAEREAEWKKARQEKDEADRKAAKQQETEQTKKKNCAGARANLKTFESNQPLTTYNEKGESVWMDDTVRQKNIEEARKQIEMYCGSE